MLYTPASKVLFVALCTLSFAVLLALACYFDLQYWSKDNERIVNAIMAQPNYEQALTEKAKTDGLPETYLLLFIGVPLGTVFFFLFSCIIVLLKKPFEQKKLFFIGNRNIGNILLLFIKCFFLAVLVWVFFDTVFLTPTKTLYEYAYLSGLYTFFSYLAIILPLALIRAALYGPTH